MFGAVTQQSGSLGSEPQFAGQQTDPDGLQYLRARFYDPATGRFLSRDAWSVADKTVFQPYVYAEDNPTTATDPSGHNACGPLQLPEGHPTLGSGIMPCTPRGGAPYPSNPTSPSPPSVAPTPNPAAVLAAQELLAAANRLAVSWGWRDGATLIRQYYDSGHGKEFLDDKGNQLSLEQYAKLGHDIYEDAEREGADGGYLFKVNDGKLYIYNENSNILLIADEEERLIFDMWHPSGGLNYFNGVSGETMTEMPEPPPAYY